MARPNKEVEALLQEYADLVSITGGDAYRARAYEKAARAIGGYPTDVSRLDAKRLREIPNVGKSIADKVEEYVRTGQVAAVEDVRAQIPAGVRELIAIPTLGPKKAMALYQELHIRSVDELADAIAAHKLRELKGFGPKTEENILHGITLMHSAGDRVQIGVAMELAEDIVTAMEKVTGCEQCTYAGSLRRMKETIGDIDILVAAEDSAPFMDAFTRLPYAGEVIAHGEKKTSLRTHRGLSVDLRVVPPDSWGAALQYFTGSKAHNIRTRELAVHQKLKLSEYGLFHAGSGSESGQKIVSTTEEEVYARLGLPWIPPTLREDRGEIAAGLRGELPELVTDADIRGDLHTHTDLTDGMGTLEQMIAAAAGRGYAYYAITDHTPDLSMQRMTDEKILQQQQAIQRLDGLNGLARPHKRMRLLHGTELNIGPEGGVDWPEEFLAGFDLCVASIHSHFNQDRDTLTRRLIRACEHPYVNIIGHPTARHIGKRPPVDIDLDALFAACARTGTALEINGQPERLDLSDENITRAKRHGVKFAINSDAHSTLHLGYVRYGVGTAQRAWLAADDVINTWPLGRLRQFLRKDCLREGRTSRPAGGKE